MKIYTIQEAADILGYKVGTLRNKLTKRELTSVKTALGVRITQQELEDFTGYKIVDGELVVK